MGRNALITACLRRPNTSRPNHSVSPSQNANAHGPRSRERVATMSVSTATRAAHSASPSFSASPSDRPLYSSPLKHSTHWPLRFRARVVVEPLSWRRLPNSSTEAPEQATEAVSTTSGPRCASVESKEAGVSSCASTVVSGNRSTAVRSTAPQSMLRPSHVTMHRMPHIVARVKEPPPCAAAERSGEATPF